MLADLKFTSRDVSSNDTSSSLFLSLIDWQSESGDMLLLSLSLSRPAGDLFDSFPIVSSSSVSPVFSATGNSSGKLQETDLWSLLSGLVTNSLSLLRVDSVRLQMSCASSGCKGELLHGVPASREGTSRLLPEALLSASDAIEKPSMLLHSIASSIFVSVIGRVSCPADCWRADSNWLWHQEQFSFCSSWPDAGSITGWATPLFAPSTKFSVWFSSFSCTSGGFVLSSTSRCLSK